MDVSEIGARRVLFATTDGSGDQLAGLMQGDPEGADPLVVLIHGLGGCEESDYLRTSATLLRERGNAVLRLNLRGAGASRPTCGLQYHAGRTADLADVVAALTGAHGVSSVFLVGFSLGGNMLLKFLAEYGTAFPVVGAASVSAPLDLEAACARILQARNRVYHRSLLRRMRDEALAAGARLSADERRAVSEAQTILQFDADFVAPRNGYASAQEYYEENTSRRFLGSIAVPTLVVHALDDPWIPAESYRAVDWTSHPHLRPLLSGGGGHVGFHGAGTKVPWHDRCIDTFLDEIAGG